MTRRLTGLAAATLVTASCANLSGLSGAVSDGGRDATAREAGHDATGRDATGRDAGHDAGLDVGQTGDAHVHGDAPAEGASDAGQRADAEAGPPLPFNHPPRTLASGQSAPQGIVAANGWVYWVAGPTIFGLLPPPPMGSRLPATIFTGPRALFSELITDGHFLYAITPPGSGFDCFPYVAYSILHDAGGVPTCGSGFEYVARLAVDTMNVYEANSINADGGAVVQIRSDRSPGGYVSSGWPVLGVVKNVGQPGATYSDGSTLWVVISPDIYAVDIVTGKPQLFVTAPHPINDMLTDDKNVYWATTDAVNSCAKTAGTCTAPTVLASGLSTPFRLAQDASALYWTDEGAVANGGSISTVAKPGGGSAMSLRTLASSLAQPYGIAVDASGVYWTDQGDGTVMMIAR